MADINKLLNFIKLTHRFYHVERRLCLPGEERAENDAEHSYQLAIVAWYIIEEEKLQLNAERAMKYALAHDLVEIHAGDVFFFEKDPAVKAAKKDREAEAAQTLAKDFAEFGNLHEIIHGYESLVDEEAKFIYALDKLLPAMTTYLDNGRTWKEERVTMEQWKQMKQEKIAVSPAVQKYFKLLADLMEPSKKDLFATVA